MNTLASRIGLCALGVGIFGFLLAASVRAEVEPIPYEKVVEIVDECQVELEAPKGNPLSRMLRAVGRTFVPGGGVIDHLTKTEAKEDRCIRDRLAVFRAEVERELERTQERLDILCQTNQCTSDDWHDACTANLPAGSPPIVCSSKSRTAVDQSPSPQEGIEDASIMWSPASPPMKAAINDLEGDYVCDDKNVCLWLPYNASP